MANLLVEKVERFHLLGHMLQVGPGVALDAEEKGKFETMISEQTCFQKVISMPEPWVRSLGREERLEKGKATHSSILA